MAWSTRVPSPLAKNDLIFARTLGTLTDSQNFRWRFRRIVEETGITGSWTTTNCDTPRLIAVRGGCAA